MSFRTTTEVMQATAGKVDTVNDQVQSELTRLQGTVDGVAGAWKGDAQVAFANVKSQVMGTMNSWNKQSSTPGYPLTRPETPTA